MKYQIINKLYKYKAMAIVRAKTFEYADNIAELCIEGGIPVMEISYTLNNATDIIKGLKEKYKDEIVCGAGTILDSQTARIAILAGADFIIAPNFDIETAKVCNRYQIPYMPGVTSISEAVEAMSYGASFIKAFPISNFYGFELVNVFKTPIPNMPILASGGIDLDNLHIWLKNGVDLCGFGSLFTKGSNEEILNNIKKVKEIISKAV